MPKKFTNKLPYLWIFLLVGYTGLLIVFLTIHKKNDASNAALKGYYTSEYFYVYWVTIDMFMVLYGGIFYLFCWWHNK